MLEKWILDGHTPMLCDDLMEWAHWMEKANRTVARTKIGDVDVSTVFLGIDHSFGFGDGEPLLFETMVFGGTLDGEQDRYATWEEAEAGHKAMCARVPTHDPTVTRSSGSAGTT